MDFNEFHARALPQITVDNDSPSFWGNGLGGEGGEVAEAVFNVMGLQLSIASLQNTAKKAERDGNRPELVGKVKDEAGDVLFYLRQVLENCGCTMEDAAQALLDKLEAMQARTVRDIPDVVREKLKHTLPREESLQAAWRAKWVLLDSQRMCDAWPKEPERVLAVVDRYVDGDPL